MRIIISDSSCLIDLSKASLLAVFLRLPFEILIPNTLLEDELLSFTDGEKKMLLHGGLKVVDLPGSQVSRAREVIRTQPRLSSSGTLVRCSWTIAEIAGTSARERAANSRNRSEVSMSVSNCAAERGDLELIETIMHILILCIS
jgi:hypothetical protein